jgi:hypothetical protein
MLTNLLVVNDLVFSILTSVSTLLQGEPLFYFVCVGVIAAVIQLIYNIVNIRGN